MYVTSPITTNEHLIAPVIATFEEALDSTAQVMNINSGDGLFFEGDDADYIYEVLEGVVRSSKVLMDGRRQVLNFCYAGEIIGLSHDRLYHCDCDAINQVKVRIHHKSAFMHETANNAKFKARLLQKAAEEINNMQEHFIMLGRKTALEKLASFLLAIMDHSKNHKNAFDLPMSRSDIADFLGMTIETVSRNLTKLRTMGVINLETAQKIIITKPSQLRALAETDI